jgi:hypothetical protein
MSNGKTKVRASQSQPATAAPIPLQPLAPATTPPSAGNLQTSRALAPLEPDPLAPDIKARSAAEERDLPKLGFAMGKGSSIEVGVDPTVLMLGPRTLFHVAVTASGNKGMVDTTTDITLRMDPEQRFDYVPVGSAQGRATGSVTTIEGQMPATIGPSKAVPTYPVALEYRRSLHLTDRDGRDCMVSVQSTMYFTYDTWKTMTAGRTPSLDTLQSLAGDFALTGVQIRGYSKVLEYHAGALSKELTIARAIADAEAILENDDSLKDAAGLPKTFIALGETAGGQFESLEAVLKRLDDKELERRANEEAVTLSGGAVDPEDNPPPWAEGMANALGKALLVIGAVIVAAFVISLLPEITFGMALAWIGASILAGSFLSSLINRIREAVDEGISNPASVLSSAVLDTIGIGGLYESITDRSLLSGRDLHRSEEERWEEGTSGALTFVMTLFGTRSTAKRMWRAPEPPRPAAPSPEPAPAPEPTPAPATPSTPPGQYTPRAGPQFVDAAQLERLPADVVESRGAHPPRQGATHTDPFSGGTYRDSDVMSRAKTARSLRTGIDAARAERLAYEDGKARHYIGLREPGHANAPGPDCLWARRNPTTGLMEIVFGDATVDPGKTPYRTPPATWVAEAGQAIQQGVLDLGDAALEAEIRTAFAAGRFVVETTLVELLPDGVRFTPL